MLKCKLLSQCLRKTKQVKLSNFHPVTSLRFATTIAAENNAYHDDAALAAAKPFEELPSDRILPFIGTAWVYLPIIGRYDLKKPHKATLDIRRRLGNIFRAKIGPMNMVFSLNADDLQTLYKHEGPYPSRAPLASLKTYRESRKQWYSTTGIMLLQGKEWHDLRTKTQKHLMKPKAIQAYMNPMQDVARDLVQKIFKIRDANNEVPNFLGELYKWALESVAFVGLDTRLGCLKMDLSPDSDGMRLIESVQTQFQCMYDLEFFSSIIQLWKYFPTPTWKRFIAASDTFSEIAFKHINRALEELKTPENEDKDPTLLQAMLLTKGLDVSGAMVTVADMLTAGIDTTSHTVGFFLYHMARNPDKQERLHQEIQNLLPRKGDRITTDTFNKLKYLKACIKESLRLTPIVGAVARVLDQDTIFSGYRVPAGTMLVVSLQAIYTDERYFSNPHQFLPERWLEKDDKFHPFSFVPFGFGTRSCIGRRLAELEIISLITELIRNFRIEYHYEDIGIRLRFINTPDRPLRYNFIER